MGGIAAVLSGIKKYADARVHADALKELTQSFQAEVAPQVVEVEGHTLRLTGTAEDQYREWRKLLRAALSRGDGHRRGAAATGAGRHGDQCQRRAPPAEAGQTKE